MFANQLDDRSISTMEGDMESKRHKLKKLYHAAHCSNEGFRVGDLCEVDLYCCATKRLLDHVLRCAGGSDCEVPCCRSSRKVWKHYIKCKHVKSCPLCSIVPQAYNPQALAPRFCIDVENGLPQNEVYQLLRGSSPAADSSTVPWANPGTSRVDATSQAVLVGSTNRQKKLASRTHPDANKAAEGSSTSSTRAVASTAPPVPRPSTVVGKENRRTRLMRKGYQLRNPNEQPPKTTTTQGPPEATGGSAKVAQRQARSSATPSSGRSTNNSRPVGGALATRSTPGPPSGSTPSDLPRPKRRSVDKHKPPRSPRRRPVYSNF